MKLTAKEQATLDLLTKKLAAVETIKLNKEVIKRIEASISDHTPVVVVYGKHSKKVSCWGLEHYIDKVSHGKRLGKGEIKPTQEVSL